MKSIILSLVLCMVASVSLMAESIEIFYFDKQEAYRLSGFEKDGPVLDKVDDSEVVGFEGERHGAWWVKGELPIVAGKAMSLADYRTKRVANTYVDRFEPRKYLVSVFFSYEERLVPKRLVGPSASLVTAWVVDGELKDFRVEPAVFATSGGNISDWQIPESSFGGRPICWIVENGEVVELNRVRPWDRALFGEAVSIDELSDYHSPKEGLTALHYAAANGDVELARTLIAANKKLVKDFGKLDWSPLSAAVENGRSEVVALLLEHKAPLFDGWENSDSIVRKACSAGHLGCVKLLAPGKPKGSDGRWHYSWGASDALNQNYQDIAIYLIEKGADFTIPKEDRGKYALSKAAAGFPDLALRLFEKFKLDPTYENDGYNLLHSVSSYGDVELLKSVTELGVPIDSVTGKGVLPVDFAVSLGNVDAICWFLDNGGRDKLGEHSVDPLKYAITENQLQSVECLIGYGFDVNKEVSSGVSPLMYAVFLDEFDIAKAISAAGGVWLMDSVVLDAVVSHLIRADEVDLFKTLVAQGWQQERRIFDAFDLLSVASFFEAKKIESVLEELDWTGAETGIVNVKDAETKPRLAAPLKVDYPLDLQERFGERSILASMVVSAEGVPLLAKIEANPSEGDLIKVVEDAVYSMRFVPAANAGVAVPVHLKIKIPLKVEFDPKSVLSLAQVEEKPSAIKMSTPMYPYSMYAWKIKGRVLVEFILLPDGSVRSPRAAKYTHEEFIAPAIQCVVRSQWEPAKVGSKKVACRVRIPIDFSP